MMTKQEFEEISTKLQEKSQQDEEEEEEGSHLMTLEQSTKKIHKNQGDIITKVYYPEKEVRRFSLGEKSFKQFCELVLQPLNTEKHPNVSLLYLDSELDWVTFSSELEWKEAITQYHLSMSEYSTDPLSSIDKKMREPYLRVKVMYETSPPPQAPPSSDFHSPSSKNSSSMDSSCKATPRNKRRFRTKMTRRRKSMDDSIPPTSEQKSKDDCSPCQTNPCERGEMMREAKCNKQYQQQQQQHNKKKYLQHKKSFSLVLPHESPKRISSSENDVFRWFFQ